MYFQPYGDDQQLNLNWIINEIINLHKQLDPDYETPSFTQVYPYSNLNRLNLDWILSELKALKELAPEPTPTIDIQAVAKALVALPFDRNTSYQIYDFISRDDEIWRATEAIAAGGEWDSSKWFKTKIGTDLSVLERWINTINNSLTSEIQARQDADTALQNTINGLTSANISDDSDAGGANVKASLNALKGSLNSEVTARRTADNNIKGLITAYIETGTTASRAYGKGQIIEVNGILYSVIQPIASGAAFTIGTNIERTTVGNEFTKFVLVESNLTFNNGSAFFYDGHIKANSKLFAGLSYLTPGSTSGSPRLYFVTVQPNIDGRAVVYIRNADGSTPPSIELTVYLIISNQV